MAFEGLDPTPPYRRRKNVSGPIDTVSTFRRLIGGIFRFFVNGMITIVSLPILLVSKIFRLIRQDIYPPVNTWWNRMIFLLLVWYKNTIAFSMFFLIALSLLSVSSLQGVFEGVIKGVLDAVLWPLMLTKGVQAFFIGTIHGILVIIATIATFLFGSFYERWLIYTRNLLIVAAVIIVLGYMR